MRHKPVQGGEEVERGARFVGTRKDDVSSEELTMGPEPSQAQKIVPGFTIDEQKIGFYMALAIARPVAAQSMVMVA
jgi:hypothetical protein